MPRTIMEISINIEDADAALRIVNSEMLANNYAKKIFKGEEIWVKGSALIEALRCFSVSFTEDSLILQGWLWDFMTGEQNLVINNRWGKFPKNEMRGMMENIDYRIANYI